jgi:hypothetical protein
MSSAAPAVPPVGPPLAQAVRALAQLDVPQIADAIWIRLTGDAEEFGLPALSPQEERIEIFVQVYEYGNNGQVSRRLHRACAFLLDLHKNEASAPENASRSRQWALGEVCYLSARIQSFDALAPLLEMAQMSRREIRENNSLLVRVLGCSVGLLGSLKDIAPHYVKQATEVFEECLDIEDCRLLALTGLVGLWPERRDEYLGRVSVDEQELNVNLTLAGFMPLETLEARFPKARE